MFKSILFSLFLTNATTVMTLPMVTSNLTMSDEEIRNDIYNNILDDKVDLGLKEFYEFNGKKISDKNLLQEEILGDNSIETITTSSNPLKIMKDYENQLLDGTKIYDVDVDQFFKVYRDAFGNVTQTAEEALKTYTNEGKVKPMYSYNNRDWFEDPAEAEIHQKDKMNIEKSIFYIYGNKYYNAFNVDDMQSLIDNFNVGYYINRTKSLDGSKTIEPIKSYGQGSDQFDKLKKDIRKDFLENYYYKVSKLEPSFKNSFTISDENHIRVTYPNGEVKHYNKNVRPTIEFVHNFSSHEEFVNDFQDKTKWNLDGREDGFLGIGGWIFWERNFSIIENGQKLNVKIGLFPKWKKIGKNSIPDFSNYTISDLTETKIKFYLDEKKENYVDQLGTTKLYDLSLSTGPQKNLVFEKWYQSFWEKVITNFSDFNNSKILYKDILKSKFINNIDKTVIKDKVFYSDLNNQTQQSVVKSFLDFSSKRDEILKTPIKQGDKVLYKLRDDFLVSEENLGNYIPLDGGLTTVTKYFFGTDMTSSGLNNPELSNTYEEAKEKSFINQNLTLRKKYIAYDVFGNKTSLANSMEEAINELWLNVNLEGKMIHKKEFDSIKWNIKYSFDNLISSGRYNAYRVLDNYSNSYLYYSTFDAALKSVMSSTSLHTKTYLKNQYLFRYRDLQTNIEYSVTFFEGDEIDAVDFIFNKMRNLN